MTELIENIYSYKSGSNTFHFSSECIVQKGSYFIIHVVQITDFKGTELEEDFENGLCIHKWKIQCKNEKSEMAAISYAGKKLISKFDPKILRCKN